MGNVTQFERTAAAPIGKWATASIKPGKLSSNFDTVMQEVKPLFTDWLKAETTFTKNTKTVAGMVRKAWQMYQKQEDHQGRIGLARLFDPSIPEGKTARELQSNPTYNRMNYLIDQVGKPKAEAAERVPVKAKREKMRRMISKFHKQYARKTITLADVDELVAALLAQIWTEDGVQEVIDDAAA